jgi:hypothetical protein
MKDDSEGMREGGGYVYLYGDMRRGEGGEGMGERGEGGERGERRGEDGRMNNKPTEIIIIIKYINRKQ